MRKKILLCKTLFVLAVLTVVSCNSSNNNPDYRDAFIGEYFGVRTYTSWSLGNPNTTTQTLDTVLVIAIGDSSLRIDGTEIVIDSEGTFYEQGGGSVSSYFSVMFSNGDSLITQLNGGGLGGGYHTTFEGEK